jgi:hypothetical protein
LLAHRHLPERLSSRLLDPPLPLHSVLAPSRLTRTNTMPLKNVRVLNLEITDVERVALCPDSASTSPRVAHSGLGLYISHLTDAMHVLCSEKEFPDPAASPGWEPRVAPVSVVDSSRSFTLLRRPSWSLADATATTKSGLQRTRSCVCRQPSVACEEYVHVFAPAVYEPDILCNLPLHSLSSRSCHVSRSTVEKRSAPGRKLYRLLLELGSNLDRRDVGRESRRFVLSVIDRCH